MKGALRMTLKKPQRDWLRDKLNQSLVTKLDIWKLSGSKVKPPGTASPQVQQNT